MGWFEPFGMFCDKNMAKICKICKMAKIPLLSDQNVFQMWFFPSFRGGTLRGTKNGTWPANFYKQNFPKLLETDGGDGGDDHEAEQWW